jgi:hypothetical protein
MYLYLRKNRSHQSICTFSMKTRFAILWPANDKLQTRLITEKKFVEQ